jgi:shikimate dehydrogenase
MTKHRAAVLGKPIAHSLSPVLHRAAYADLGLAWTYEAIECDAAGLPTMLADLAVTHAGLSLTMPLKEAVLPLLDDMTEAARTVGAVNTVLYHGHHRVGANTDIAGVLAALDELGVEPAGTKVALLGAGGAARAALAALARCRVAKVTVVVRQPARAEGLRRLAGRLGVSVTIRSWAPGALRGQLLVVSTVPSVPDLLALLPATSAGAASWPPETALLDLVYAPWPTPLAALAQSAGARVLGGLAMLVAQAADQVRLMTGREPAVAAMRAAGEAALSERCLRTGVQESPG